MKRRGIRNVSAGRNRMNNCNARESNCGKEVVHGCSRQPRWSIVNNVDHENYTNNGCCPDRNKPLAGWQSSCKSFVPTESGRCRYPKVYPKSLRNDKVVTCICHPPDTRRNTSPCYKQRCNEYGHDYFREPSSIVKCDTICSSNRRGEDKTTVYLCESQPQSSAHSGHDMDDCEYAIGSCDDMRPQYISNYTICPSDVVCETNGDDQCFDNMSRQSDCCESARCPTMCRLFNNAQWQDYSCFGEMLWLLVAPFFWLLKLLFILLMFAFLILAQLIFMNFNNLGHFFSIFFVVLLLYILLIAPDNLLVYQYLM